MKFRDFEIQSYPVIQKAPCKCGTYCIEVSNGFFENALFCPKCEKVYELRMIKVPEKKVSEEYLTQCRNTAKRKEQK